jgi:hypothetical protein
MYTPACKIEEHVGSCGRVEVTQSISYPIFPATAIPYVATYAP